VLEDMPVTTCLGGRDTCLGGISQYKKRKRTQKAQRLNVFARPKAREAAGGESGGAGGRGSH